MAYLDRRRLATGYLRDADADAQVLRESARQADEAGSSGVGPSYLTKRHPSTRGAGSKTNSKSRVSTVGARSGLQKRSNFQPSKKVLMDGVWVHMKGIRTPNHRPSAEAAASSRKKSVEDRHRKGQDDLGTEKVRVTQSSVSRGTER